MISPAWLSGCTDAIKHLCAETEQSILDDMARRLAAYDFYIPAAQYQEEKLKLLGASRGVIRRELARRTQKAEAEIARLMQEGARQSLKNSGYLYEAAGKTPPKTLSAGMKSLLLSAYRQTAGTLQNLTRTTAKTAVGELEHALDLAWMQVSLGAMDPKSAVKGAVKRLADAGLSAVTYPSGHTDSLTTAVTRAVRTGVNQGAIRLQEELARELGTDLVEVTAHAGARPEHALWQGKIYSLSGKTPGYEKLSDATGYGTGAGLGGWNCRHSFFPYVEGSPNATPKELLEQYENEAFLHYRGKTLTQSEADRLKSRIQNRLGKWQREESMLRAAGLDAAQAKQKAQLWKTKQETYFSAYEKALEKAGDHGIIKWKPEELIELSKSVDRELDAYCSRKSKWSGRTRVAELPDDILGRKEWSCDITLSPKAGIKTIIHEHLHARSVSYYSALQFSLNRPMEEGTVELFAQEICKRNKIPCRKAYPKFVNPLRSINAIVHIRTNDYDFASVLFELPMGGRYRWLRTQILREYKNGTISEQEQKKALAFLKQLKR